MAAQEVILLMKLIKIAINAILINTMTYLLLNVPNVQALHHAVNM